MDKALNSESNSLKLIKLGIDTGQEFIVFMRSDCFICKSEGFEAQGRIVVTLNGNSIIATLNIVNSNILQDCEASLSESAWERLNAHTGDSIYLSHLPPIASMGYVRSKIYGKELNAQEFKAIISDIVAGKYANIHLSSFITACGNNNLSTQEITYLTQAMVITGEQLHWDYPIVIDKHSVGGIPGNRTTPIVVAIVAAAGLIIPKTSSRAITSPAGTVDTIETMTPVTLTIPQIQKVVAREGGCMVWGGSLGLSPSDDLLIRVERVLDLDPMGQMIASVLSKKIAVGATHVLIDIPVGPTAKIRSDLAFAKYQSYFSSVGKALGLQVYTLKTYGDQPLGKGIGPALEAKDILAVLRNDKEAPTDLKNKALLIAATLLEFGKKVPAGQGKDRATQLLENGTALKKFLAICEAQGGFKEPPSKSLTYDVVAKHSGLITEIDNRNLAQVAKLAGAPHDQAAGMEFFAKLGMNVEKGQTLYRIHAESKGALDYSRNYALSMPNIIKIISQET
ncbi:thymidine phosphorylase family protein [Legionella maioricensis]|uniref:Putative thymidine phosphorylase n=1 Tax=Legionella maioricensis TaxID=2896528 RepID=A0A9X2IC81_9GAMM|nr:thymidine phosphorylase family protein [Legionella maioricensis]MCL9684966.1 thymidine phosphorylase family protein [Legionella maioricensis]MCL9688202.1 thymidine phosphorylase family protein [Legionella maioricensis]